MYSMWLEDLIWTTAKSAEHSQGPGEEDGTGRRRHVGDPSLHSPSPVEKEEIFAKEQSRLDIHIFSTLVYRKL